MSTVFKALPFPEDAWSAEVVGRDSHDTRILDEHWADAIALQPPPGAEEVEGECRGVMKLKKLRASHLEAIVREAEYIGIPIAVLSPALTLGGFLARLKLQLLIQRALYDLELGVFRQKKLFNRGRPYHCCNLPLEPVFPPGSLFYPGHPSYPSGHAASAHTIALIGAELVSAKGPAMREAAWRVARNRQIAGLHYESDSLAGEALAQQFVELLKKSDKFNAMLMAVRQEWDAMPR